MIEKIKPCPERFKENGSISLSVDEVAKQLVDAFYQGKTTQGKNVKIQSSALLPAQSYHQKQTTGKNVYNERALFSLSDIKNAQIII